MFIHPSFRWTSLPLALLMLLQAFVATPAYGLSGGPTQPEFQQTSVVGADDLVDPFTGNFNYSIPLFEIGGYPINLTYTSDHKMEEEASWVGFGWTLNPGAISRQVQGLPDDFRGDEITHRGHVRPSVTTGITPGAKVEIFGGFGLATALDFSYNNYAGYRLDRSLSPSINILKAITDISAGESTETAPRSRLGSFLRENNVKTNISANISSRGGLQSLSYGAQFREFSTGNSYPLGGFTYTPVSDLPRSTVAGIFQLNAGGKFTFADAVLGTLTGYGVVQSLAQSTISQPAYGYLYLDGADTDRTALMDYNTEKGGVVDENSPRLSMPYGTPDVFSVTGPGMSGQLEVTRNDLGAFRPAYVEASSVSGSTGFEVGAGNLFHAGIDISAVVTTDRRDTWTEGNFLGEELGFTANAGIKEAVYLRMVGDQTAHTSTSWYNAIGSEHPVVAPPLPGNERIGLANTLAAVPGGGNQGTVSLGYPTETVFPVRRPRATMVSYLSAREALVSSAEKLPRFTAFRGGQQANYSTLDSLPLQRRVDPALGSKGHHLGEIRITNSSGQRFVYGLPVYNTTKEETTFNASELRKSGGEYQEGEANFGMVSYANKRTAATIANEQGLDQYFDQIVTGAYPAAHLLTGVLAPDYIDRTGDGPSLDDGGNYVKVGYSPLQVRGNTEGTSARVGWRTPMGEYQAVLNEGNLADTEDDKGSFVYGEKEVYYVHHMDSKTHRAVFLTSDRSDAKPVNRDGVVVANGVRLQKLDSIKIYTLTELYERGSAAEPLKTVHFAYKADNSTGQISGNLPNADANAGKLTLHSVSFTYADNQRGRENPYTFDYQTHIVDSAGDSTKVVYQPFMVDRWGTQRGPIASPLLDPMSYPYSNQDSVEAARYCDQGNLIRIGLPSGAEIKIDYEPDEYAYVQDKRAGRMFRLLGFSETFDQANLGTNSYSTSLYQDRAGLGVPYLYTYVDVGTIPREPDGKLPSVESLKRLYLQDVEQLYYQAHVRLRDNPVVEERVTGYSEFDQDFIAALPGTSPSSDRIVIRLTAVNRQNQETNRKQALHPITYTALEKLRQELPRLLYTNAPEERKIDPFAMLAFLNQEGLSIRNYFARRTSRGDAQTILPAGSFVRLAEPTFAKIGDGSRVAQVELDDNWLVEPPTEDDNERHAAKYVKTYSYTTTDPLTKQIISSGVAGSEPMNGKEEMLQVKREKSFDDGFLASNEAYYNESPLGLQFFPGAQVGYAKVQMRMQLLEKYQQSKPGITEYNYFTARDFPVTALATKPIRSRIRPSPQILSRMARLRDRLAVTQGFAIQVNDMHGKMQSTKEYGYDGELISSTKYTYREASATGPAGERSLANLLPVVRPPGFEGNGAAVAGQAQVGLDVDLWIETSEEETTAAGGGVQLNPEGSFLGFFPLFGVFSYPQITNAVTSLQTATFTKLVRRYGILESVTVTNNGSALTTTNRRWDALTGTPVLTSTENEFDQPIYSQTLPAYWMKEHAGMGPAYANQGISLPSSKVVNGRIIHPLQQDQFDQNRDLRPGDEVTAASLFLAPLQLSRHRFYAVPVGDSLVLIDEVGKRASTAQLGILSSAFGLQIARSGNRNILMASAGQTTSLTPPQTSVGYWQIASTNGALLTSSAVEYSDEWSNQCDSVTTYSYGTPQDSMPPPPPVDCPDLLAEVNNYNILINTTSGGSNGEPEFEIQGADWADRREDLTVCDACETLFVRYLREGLIPNYSQYGRCTTNGFIIDNQTAVDNCDFLVDPNAPYLSSTGRFRYDPPVPSECRRIQSSQFRIANFQGFDAPIACPIWTEDGDQNPYLTGRRGNWRPAASYVAKQAIRSASRFGAEQRTDARDNDYGQPLIYRDGPFADYVPFWSQGMKFNRGSSHQLTSRILRYDDHGHEVETIDALGIPSGAQYGFNQQLPTAVAQNARGTDLGYDGFEDYRFDRGRSSERWLRHFSMLDREAEPDKFDTKGLSQDAAHTGKFSYKTTNGSGPLTQIFDTYECSSQVARCPDELACPCISGFTPVANRRYLVSAWIASEVSLASGRHPGQLPGVTSPQGAGNSVRLETSTKNTNGTIKELAVAYAAGPVVEGWQQIQLELVIPEGASSLQVSIRPPSSTANGTFDYYFDDVRIQPYEADMTTYAYDPVTLRLMAQMDDRGYAVFYEYDDEGMLVRQKRETERGIMTITEQHTNLAPVNGKK